MSKKYKPKLVYQTINIKGRFSHIDKRAATITFANKAEKKKLVEFFVHLSNNDYSIHRRIGFNMFVLVGLSPSMINELSNYGSALIEVNIKCLRYDFNKCKIHLNVDDDCKTCEKVKGYSMYYNGSKRLDPLRYD